MELTGITRLLIWIREAVCNLKHSIDHKSCWVAERHNAKNRQIDHIVDLSGQSASQQHACRHLVHRRAHSHDIDVVVRPLPSYTRCTSLGTASLCTCQHTGYCTTLEYVLGPAHALTATPWHPSHPHLSHWSHRYPWRHIRGDSLCPIYIATALHTCDNGTSSGERRECVLVCLPSRGPEAACMGVSLACFRIFISAYTWVESCRSRGSECSGPHHKLLTARTHTHTPGLKCAKMTRCACCNQGGMAWISEAWDEGGRATHQRVHLDLVDPLPWELDGGRGGRRCSTLCHPRHVSVSVSVWRVRENTRSGACADSDYYESYALHVSIVCRRRRKKGYRSRSW